MTSMHKIASVGTKANAVFRTELFSSVSNKLSEAHRTFSSGGEFNHGTPTMYDKRKYGHCLPDNSVMTPFEPLMCIPTGIFRCTTGEVLGRCAHKCGVYKNPEYFSFQHMTFYDMHLILRQFRNPCPDSQRKPI